MSTSRDTILSALRRSRHEALLPDRLVFEPISFDDSESALHESFEAAGGVCVRVPASEGLEAALADLPAVRAATTIVSAVAEIGSTPSHDPRSGLDLCVVRGGPAVAESGAVWWAPGDEHERAAAFLAEHLILIVARREVVDDLHTAYTRCDASGSAYGCWVAGPSKTADIEQALVIGAHGPRAATLLLHGD
jgi:L-lactate dehydrogenase complex protein LldG